MTYTCTVCSKKCPSNSNLEYHMLSHTGQRPFKCSLCSSDYKRASHLLDHERVKHPEEYKQKLLLERPQVKQRPRPNRIFANYQSGQQVEGKNSRQRPVSRIHRRPVIFNNTRDPCPYCPSSFVHYMGVKVHVAKMHKDVYKEFCNEETKRKSIEVQELRKTIMANTTNATSSIKPKLKSWNNFFTHRDSSNEMFNKSSAPDSGDVLYCTLCQEEFYEQHYLNVHMRDWHKGHNYDKSSTDSPARLERKRKLDTSSKGSKEMGAAANAHQSDDDMSTTSSYKCKVCTKSFSSRDQLKIHRALHARRSIFSCRICGRRFATIEEKEAHKLTAHKEVSNLSPPPSSEEDLSQLSSSMLDRETSQTTESTVHRENSTRNDKKKGKYALYQCPICEYRECTDLALTEHVNTIHDRGGIYECRHCDIVTVMASDLLQHVKTHDQERPFSCDICGMRFREREAKYIHQEEHDDEEAI